MGGMVRDRRWINTRPPVPDGQVLLDAHQDLPYAETFADASY